MPRRENTFAVKIERSGRSFGAYVPQLRGCVAVASAGKSVRKLIREAIALHIEDMERRGEKIPLHK